MPVPSPAPSAEPAPAVPPLRLAFRRQVREAALDAAHRLVVGHGWDLVRVGQVATAVGVSRPTLYKEFGSKQGLGEALVLRETERFLDGVSQELARHDSDVAAGISAAVRYTLDRAGDDPLLHAVLTSSRDGGDSLLPLLTTRSAPVLDAASAALHAWLDSGFPQLDADVVADAVDTVVRLTVSHLVLPVGDPEQTVSRLTRIALRCLQVADPAPGGSAAS